MKMEASNTLMCVAGISLVRRQKDVSECVDLRKLPFMAKVSHSHAAEAHNQSLSVLNFYTHKRWDVGI